MKATENKAQPEAKAPSEAKAPPDDKAQPAAKPAAADSSTKAMDAEALLKADHRKVEDLFAQFEQAEDASAKAELVQQVCRELIVHTMLEEELFYPACREKNVEDDALDEAQVEHDGAKVLIGDLLKADPGADYYDAKVTVLSEYIKHHVKEEEQAGTGIFAKAKAAGVDMDGLGTRLQARKQELMKQAEASRLEAPRPKSLALQSQNNTRQETNSMARNGNQDRDDRGRYTSDDDRGGRARYRDDDDDRRYGASNHRDRDERGRFTSDDGDDRRGSYGRDRDDERRYTSSGDRDRDDRGRFSSSDDRGGRSRSRDDDDDRRYGRSSSNRDDDDRGRGDGRGDGRGWFGDSEGHRRAAEQRSDRGGSSRSRSDDDDDDRRRYSASNDRDRDDRGRYAGSDDRSGRSRSRDDDDDRRYGASSHRDRDDRGRFTSDDDRGGRSRSRDDDDDRRYSRSSSGRDDDDRARSDGRGWFGDSEGHRRAALQRSDRGSSRSRDDDDDDRGNRGSSSRRRGSSDRDEGHGGWFGDSRGHAEAARKGWQNR